MIKILGDKQFTSRPAAALPWERGAKDAVPVLKEALNEKTTYPATGQHLGTANRTVQRRLCKVAVLN